MAFKLSAGAAFPAINLPAVAGGTLTLGEPQNGCDWRIIVVYRGLHCPRCKAYLTQYNEMQDRFRSIGVDPVCVSGDGVDKAKEMAAELSLTVPVAYALSIETMLELGLYVSHPRDANETDQPFSEPGIFVVNDAGQAQIIDIGNASFTRPDLETFLSGLAFTREKGFPIRGTLTAD